MIDSFLSDWCVVVKRGEPRGEPAKMIKENKVSFKGKWCDVVKRGEPRGEPAKMIRTTVDAAAFYAIYNKGIA